MTSTSATIDGGTPFNIESVDAGGVNNDGTALDGGAPE